MKRLVLLLGVLEAVSHGAVLFETAPFGEVGSTSPWGIGVGYLESSEDPYVGWLFEVIDPGWEIQQVGGHFLKVAYTDGTLFAAVLEVVGPGPFPVNPPFEAEDVLASTTFLPPYPSSDYRIDLQVTLSPGFYALVFGANGLGASDGYMAIQHQPPVEGWLPRRPIYAYSNQAWRLDHSTYSELERVVIEGEIIPEPATLLLLGLGGLFLRRRR